jgi:protocadherin Fat 4
VVFCVQVEAIDSGTPALTGSAKVTVRITDVDDSGPVFVQNPFTFHVQENGPPRTYVGDVTAVDADLPPFNSHAYKLLSGFDVFEIDKNNGLFNHRLLPLIGNYNSVFTQLY